MSIRPWGSESRARGGGAGRGLGLTCEASQAGFQSSPFPLFATPEGTLFGNKELRSLTFTKQVDFGT